MKAISSACNIALSMSGGVQRGTIFLMHECRHEPPGASLYAGTAGIMTTCFYTYSVNPKPFLWFMHASAMLH